jgi:hypothetical protein
MDPDQIEAAPRGRVRIVARGILGHRPSQSQEIAAIHADAGRLHAWTR